MTNRAAARTARINAARRIELDRQLRETRTSIRRVAQLNAQKKAEALGFGDWDVLVALPA